MFFDLLVSARQAGKRYIISRGEACASLRGSLLLEGMIAQAAKFCKPLLDKFGKPRQIECYLIAFARKKSVQAIQNSAGIMPEHGEMHFQNLEGENGWNADDKSKTFTVYGE